jgi:hypothetical protein
MESPFFYHGTQTAIHTSTNPFLDPTKCLGGDEGDPERPHVFLTKSLNMARVYALKTPGLKMTISSKSGFYAIYNEEPNNVGVGYVYKISQLDYPEFEEIVVQGRRTHRWVSYNQLDTRTYECEVIRGIEHLSKLVGLMVYRVPPERDWIEVILSISAARNVSEEEQENVLCSHIEQENLLSWCNESSSSEADLVRVIR